MIVRFFNHKIHGAMNFSSSQPSTDTSGFCAFSIVATYFSYSNILAIDHNLINHPVDSEGKESACSAGEVK